MALDIGELRGKSEEELHKELHSIQRALLGLSTQLANQASENTAGVGKLRREIAQVKTVLRQRRIEAAASAAPGAGEQP